LDAPVLLIPVEVVPFSIALTWRLRRSRWMWIPGRRRCWSARRSGIGCLGRSSSWWSLAARSGDQEVAPGIASRSDAGVRRRRVLSSAAGRCVGCGRVAGGGYEPGAQL